MTDHSPEPTELDPPDPDLADRLRIARPVPGAAFRGVLSRRLAEQDPGYGPRPERLRLMVAGYLGAGGVLIALAALGLS
ncbi:MAG TPA: hypothetical protein VFH80_09400 [Solirubrobacteraceae bacterium]|nr:hypothetical protein [Solirubrobacteraceae bacterium]